MKLSPGQPYFERTIALTTDPLTVMTELASTGLHEDHIVYERPREWSYAGGVLAQIWVDRTGACLAQGDSVTLRAWDGPPLRHVQQLLETINIPGWRAYGWAAFEFAYAKDGDRSNIGEQRLLHLVVPRTEVRISGDHALIRSADAAELDKVVAIILGATDRPTAPASPVDVRHGGGDYERAVAAAIDGIHAERLQKVILSRTFAVDTEIDFAATYRHGRQANNPARSFLLRLGDIEAAGFSPEVVVAVDVDGRVISQPLAGTRALTDDVAQNRKLRAELLSNPKEIYEHAISVKIAHDELLDVCESETLFVEEFMAIRERGTVQHLASRVAGHLAPSRDAWDAFVAVFPAVTASGVPKAEAFAEIRTHEPTARGLYSGAVLIVDQDGALDAALVLRAVYRQHGRTWLQAGAGIVGQSQPQREFEETSEKLDSVARFLVPAHEHAITG